MRSRNLRFTPRPLAALLAIAALLVPAAGHQSGTTGQIKITLPQKEGSLKFAVIGDSGTGGSAQYEVAKRMAEAHALFPFELVLMMGDNLYGSERPQDYEKKFERPYKPLLDAKVKFYASLGNHDDREQRMYKLFNMGGELYYTFKAPEQDVRFFALESTYPDRRQMEWLERELKSSGEDWKIVFFHHPIYSSGGRHGSSLDLRQRLEPLFIKYNVSAVLAGHEHFYERIKPQNGILYMTSGGAAKLREGNIRPNSPLTAKGFDDDNHFVLMEIEGDEMYFQAISRRGETVDSGSFRRRQPETTSGGPAGR
ncbi:MAG: metallophosphoesterase [Vicinamibacterales bacterium]